MEDFEEAYRKALRLLSVKGRFQHELEERLKKEGFSKEAIAQAMERCAKAGYLNDVERGRLKVISRARKGYGARRIELELFQHLDNDQIAKVLNEYDEKEILRRYLEKHPKLLDDPKGKLRLLRRGFNRDNIDEVFSFF